MFTIIIHFLLLQDVTHKNVLMNDVKEHAGMGIILRKASWKGRKISHDSFRHSTNSISSRSRNKQILQARNTTQAIRVQGKRSGDTKNTKLERRISFSSILRSCLSPVSERRFLILRALYQVRRTVSALSILHAISPMRRGTDKNSLHFAWSLAGQTPWGRVAIVLSPPSASNKQSLGVDWLFHSLPKCHDISRWKVRPVYTGGNLHCWHYKNIW